jgi:hypothetical protein
MVCFAACVIVSLFEKRGKNERKRGTTHTRTPLLCLWDPPLALDWLKMGSALFSLLCCFVSSSLHHHIKNKTLVPPAGTYIYTLLHHTDRQIRGSFELDRFARKQYHRWQNVRIIYLTERGKREKERKLVKKR